MNSTADPRCDWYHSAAQVVELICKIQMPILFTFGLLGQSLLLIALYQQSKKETAYWYQIVLTLSEVALIFTRASAVLLFYYLTAFEGTGPTWFSSCYGCLWVAAHFTIPLKNMFVTTSLLLAVVMSADRIFALGKPFVYKNIKHKRHQAIACATCVAIGISSSFFSTIQFYPKLGKSGFYFINIDSAFVASKIAVVLSQLRNAVQIIGTVALLCCNAVMIILYRKYVRKVENVGAASEVKKRREQKKVLMVLAVSESVCNLISMSAVISLYAMLFTIPNFNQCENPFITPLTDITVDVAAAADCYVAFIVSKTFRKMIFESVPCFRRFADATKGVKNVVVAATGHGQNAAVTPGA